MRSYGFTWKQIVDMLLVSRWTIRRRVVEIWIKLAWGQGGKCLFLQRVLHCGLTTLLTVVSVVVDNVYELLMLKFAYVERHVIGGLTLKGRVVET